MANPVTDRIAQINANLVGRYVVERELGQGGMATVYLAEDVKHHRKVAIKVLRDDLSASIGAARFQREIEIAAQLQHPNILPLLDSGEAGGMSVLRDAVRAGAVAQAASGPRARAANRTTPSGFSSRSSTVSRTRTSMEWYTATSSPTT